jgi:hypothetical protein
MVQPISFVLFNIAIVLVSAYYQKSFTIPEIRHLLKFMFFSLSEWVIVVKLQIGILFSGISWREHVTFIDMMMSTLY